MKKAILILTVAATLFGCKKDDYAVLDRGCLCTDVEEVYLGGSLVNKKYISSYYLKAPDTDTLKTVIAGGYLLRYMDCENE